MSNVRASRFRPLVSSQVWSRGASQPDSGAWDALSVATHELGHAAGRAGHLSSGAGECKGHPTAVMCAKIEPGYADQRDPRKHDEPPFPKAY